MEPQVTLDRPPFGKYETEIANGFPQIEALEEIWIREVNSHLTGSYPVMRVYLAFRVLDAASREMADRVQEAFESRNYFEKVEFEFKHIPFGKIPKDLPSRIWKRAPRILTPAEYRAGLTK